MKIHESEVFTTAQSYIKRAGNLTETWGYILVLVFVYFKYTGFNRSEIEIFDILPWNIRLQLRDNWFERFASMKMVECSNPSPNSP